MNRRRFLGQIAGASGMGLWLANTSCLGERKNKPSFSSCKETNLPNIVFIVSDDHRWDMMSCAGNPYIKTPHLDRLAREGVYFTNAFATSGLCSPSRASILTGQYAFQTGAPMIMWMNNTFHRHAKPFPAQLQEAGYYTAHIGKWHLGQDDKPQKGYDYWVGFEWIGEFFNPTLVIDGVSMSFNGFCDDILSDLAAQKIRQLSCRNQPFCVYVALKSPHLPFSYPERYKHAFDDIAIPPPPTFDEDFAKSGKPAALRDVIGIKTFKNGLPLFQTWDNYIKSYYRSCLAIDDAVGGILKALDETGTADNTLVIYTSDQGYSLGEHGLTEKHYGYEQICRVPLLMRWPGRIPSGKKIERVALNIDLAPTIMDFCATLPNISMTGKSLRPLIEDETIPWRDDFLFETVGWGKIPGQLMVRSERYKLITYPWHPAFSDELYDLKTDPFETVNRIHDPAYAQTAEQMKRRLARLKKETGWRKYVPYLAEKCYFLDVPPEHLPTIRALLSDKSYLISAKRPIAIGNTVREWQIRDIDSLNKPQATKEEASHLLIGFIITRKTPRDPFMLALLPPNMPIRATVNGQVYLDVGGGDDGISRLKAQFNPPLINCKNLLVFEIPANYSFSIRFYAPEKTINIEP